MACRAMFRLLGDELRVGPNRVEGAGQARPHLPRVDKAGDIGFNARGRFGAGGVGDVWKSGQGSPPDFACEPYKHSRSKG